MKRSHFFGIGLFILIIAFIATYFAFMATHGQICAQGVDEKESYCTAYCFSSFAPRFWLRFFDLYNGLIQGLAAIAVCWFTYWLMRIAKKQAEISSNQVSLQKAQFIRDHRPKLIVRNIFFAQGGPDGDAFCYSLINVGGSKATLVESIVIAEIMEDKNARPYSSVGHNQLGAVTFEAGERRDFTLPDKIDAGLHVRFGKNIDKSFGSPIRTLYISGSFCYMDEMLTARESTFVRRYKDGVFERTGNSDHEYCD